MSLASPHPSLASRCSDSSNSTSISPVSPDNLIVQLLTRLDAESYNNAVSIDAKSLSRDFLLPHDFPWCRFRKYYNKDVPPSTETFVDKELPFDIDELDSICYYSDRG